MHSMQSCSAAGRAARHGRCSGPGIALNTIPKARAPVWRGSTGRFPRLACLARADHTEKVDFPSSLIKCFGRCATTAAAAAASWVAAWPAAAAMTADDLAGSGMEPENDYFLQSMLVALVIYVTMMTIYIWISELLSQHDGGGGEEAQQQQQQRQGRRLHQQQDQDQELAQDPFVQANIRSVVNARPAGGSAAAAGPAAVDISRVASGSLVAASCCAASAAADSTDEILRHSRRVLRLRLRELRSSGHLRPLASAQLLSLQGRAYLGLIDQQLLRLQPVELEARGDSELEASIMACVAERVALDAAQRMTSIFLDAVSGCKARCS